MRTSSFDPIASAPPTVRVQYIGDPSGDVFRINLVDYNAEVHNKVDGMVNDAENDQQRAEHRLPRNRVSRVVAWTFN
jgi:hypothetical protein